MTRAVRRANLAGMADEDLALTHKRVSDAVAGGAQDPDHLLEDIEAEMDLRTREPI